MACGGSGGHLAPAIALAERLQENGHASLLLISQKQVDAVLVKKYGHLNFVQTSACGFAGGILSRMTSVIRLIPDVRSSRSLLEKEAPDLVLLFGGYVSLGLGLASKILGIPLVLHEANCNPGRVIRLIKDLSVRIYLPDEVKLPGSSPSRIRHFGYPVRKEIRPCLKETARKQLKIAVPNKLLVVIGGSQGSTALNDWVVRHFYRLAEAGISVYCVTGPANNQEDISYKPDSDGLPFTARFVSFSDCMGPVISAADLVLSRAGAGTIAELIRCHVPSILVPYPYATDNHQHANARVHEQQGAGLLVPQSQPERFTDEVIKRIFNDRWLSQVKSNLEQLNRFDSSERIVSDLIELCRIQKMAKTGEWNPII